MNVQRVKNIIVLCDGTWNGPSVGTSTNILRLRDIISQIPAVANVTNALGSFEGVGIGKSIEEFFLNGAFAQDLDKKIVEAYTFVVEQYDEQYVNRVWLFGFSRGAYTVRSVAGMTNNCGIVNRNNPNLPVDRAVDLAYSIYRKRGDEYAPHPNPPDVENVATRFRNNVSYPGSDASIVFMGLWDTVGADGIPSYGADGLKYLEFYDKVVSSHINYVYQAVAAHENIALFEHCPILQRPGATNTVEQKWFPGIHLDIGGYVDASAVSWPATMVPAPVANILLDNPISDATLIWMINNINNAQNNFTLGGNIILPNPATRTGFLVRLARRTIKMLSSSGVLRLIIRDRNIPFGINDPAAANVLYNGGQNWNKIANSADYSSLAYTIFRDKCRVLSGIIVPLFG